MSAQLQERYSANITLERGRGGVFDVTVDGSQLFSKHDLGRFPETGEIEQLIDALGS